MTKQGDAFRRIYKCITPVLPRALTAVFKKTSTTSYQLKFSGEYDFDKEFSKEVNGYIAEDLGDSGSPYWMPSKDQHGQDRFTLLAVHSGAGAYAHLLPTNFQHFGYFAADPAKVTSSKFAQCRKIATKLTPAIVAWVKKKSGIPRVRPEA